MGVSLPVPILVPIELDRFWETIRLIIREEIQRVEKEKPASKTEWQTPGLIYKPLYKLEEVKQLLQVSRTTIYEWIKLEKLKPYKIRSRLYFLWDDIQKLLNATQAG